MTVAYLTNLFHRYIDSIPKTLGNLYDSLGFMIPQKLAPRQKKVLGFIYLECHFTKSSFLKQRSLYIRTNNQEEEPLLSPNDDMVIR